MALQLRRSTWSDNICLRFLRIRNGSERDRYRFLCACRLHKAEARIHQTPLLSLSADCTLRCSLCGIDPQRVDHLKNYAASSVDPIEKCFGARAVRFGSALRQLVWWRMALGLLDCGNIMARLDQDFHVPYLWSEMARVVDHISSSLYGSARRALNSR